MATSTVNDRTPRRDIESPDLMSIDDKCDAVFGKADKATKAWVTASLAVLKADYGMPRGGEHRG